ncbi:MAG: hypothetical protein MRQ05_05230 [Candidatus Midichloria mitochondrii]|nr:hypothetical protein [Candidatus Midichloria mitochondrii]
MTNPTHTASLAKQFLGRALGLCLQTQYISWKNRLTGILLTSNLRGYFNIQNGF